MTPNAERMHNAETWEQSKTDKSPAYFEALLKETVRACCINNINLAMSPGEQG